MTTTDDKKTIVDPPATRRVVTEPMPTRRRALPPTIPMTAVMPSRPSSQPPPAHPPTLLSYQAYSAGHIPPVRPAAPKPPARKTKRLGLALLGVVIVGGTAAAVIASLDEGPAPAGSATISSGRLPVSSAR